MNTNSVRNDFENEKAAALEIVEQAKREGRDLTEGERKAVEQRFNRMKALEAQESAIKAIVQSSFNDSPNSKATIDGKRLFRKGESISEAMGFSKPRLSLGAFMAGMILGPKNDHERFALQQGSNSTGGFTAPVDLAAAFIDRVKDESAFVRAGAKVVPMFDRWRASTVVSPTATFRAEDASVSTSAPFTSYDLDPKNLNCIVKVSKEQLQDSVNIGDELEREIVSAMVLAADENMGFGGGSEEPSGIAGTSGILSVTAGGPLVVWSDFTEALYKLQLNNAQPTAAIIAPYHAQIINNATDENNNPLVRPAALDFPFIVSAAVPVVPAGGTLLVGDFTRLLIAVRLELEIEVLKDLYAANNQVGFKASIRLDSVPVRAKSFCKIDDINES
jgi:HK97 family phage major capsid protein